MADFLIHLWGKAYPAECEGEKPKVDGEDWGAVCTIEVMGKKVPLEFGVERSPDGSLNPYLYMDEGEDEIFPSCYSLHPASLRIHQNLDCARQFLGYFPHPVDVSKNWSDYDMLARFELKWGELDLHRQEDFERFTTQFHLFEVVALVAEQTEVSMAELLATAQVESKMDMDRRNPELQSVCPALGLPKNQFCEEMALRSGFGSVGLGHFFNHPQDRSAEGAAWEEVTEDPEFQLLWSAFLESDEVVPLPKRGESVYGDFLAIALYHRQHSKEYGLSLETMDRRTILARRAAYNLSPQRAKRVVPYFLGEVGKPGWLRSNTVKDYKDYANLVLTLNRWLDEVQLNPKE